MTLLTLKKKFPQWPNVEFNFLISQTKDDGSVKIGVEDANVDAYFSKQIWESAQDRILLYRARAAMRQWDGVNPSD